jgi:RNA polymerase sigma factor (sigma-70 family)
MSQEVTQHFSAWRAGDAARLDALVRRVTPFLWHLARSYRLDAATAEDAVQLTLLALVRHADQVEDPRAVLRWLTVTARRESWRLARANHRVEPVPDIDDATAAVPTAPDDQQPEAAALATATRRSVWRNVNLLPERCQRLLRVVAAAGPPDYASLAGALGMPVGSIGPTRGRCLAKLRALLAADPEWST